MTHKIIDLDCASIGCKAFLSTNARVEVAIVFVHGFRGNPIGTWKDFPGIADIAAHSPQWVSCDLYFFDYGDTVRSIDDSSDDLEEFLNKIYPRPIEGVVQSCDQARSRPERTPIEYGQLILVGHSEGGVVIRACIAELGKKLYRDGANSPILGARLVLFAPALFGFLPTRWFGLVYQFFPLGKLVDLVTAWSIPAAEMLDVRVLDQIRESNERLSSEFPDHDAFTAHVVFGVDETVVRRQRYFQDVKYTAIEGKNHVNVCKPSLEYQTPLPFVIGGD
jgi:pimeloyl-ACP methyl ester carboxylesterase